MSIMYTSLGLLFAYISSFVLVVILLSSWVYVGWQIINERKLNMHFLVFITHFFSEEIDMFVNAKTYKDNGYLDWKLFIDNFSMVSLAVLAFTVINFFAMEYLWIVYAVPMAVFFIVYAKIVNEYVSVVYDDEE